MQAFRIGDRTCHKHDCSLTDEYSRRPGRGHERKLPHLIGISSYASRRNTPIALHPGALRYGPSFIFQLYEAGPMSFFAGYRCVTGDRGRGDSLNISRKFTGLRQRDRHGKKPEANHLLVPPSIKGRHWGGFETIRFPEGQSYLRCWGVAICTEIFSVSLPLRRMAGSSG